MYFGKDIFSLSSLRQRIPLLIDGLRNLPPRYYFTWTMMLISILAMQFSISKVRTAYDRKLMIPAADKRLDIEQLSIAPAARVCPTWNNGITKQDFENCLKSLPEDRKGLDQMSIPTVEKIFKKYPPRFLDLLKKQGFESTADAIRSGETYLIGFNIPGEKFSPTALGEEVNVLAFHFMIDGYFCIDGECVDKVTRWDNYARGVKLVSSNEVGSTKDKIVWVFARDIPFSVGIPLMNGVFVANNKDLIEFNRMGHISYQIISLLFAVLFFGLVLLLFFLCVFFGYTDYALFTFLCLSVGLFALSEQDELFNGLKAMTYFKLKLFLELNLSVVAILFSLATTRLKLSLEILAAIGLYAIAILYILLFLPNTTKEVVAIWPLISITNAYICTIIAPAIALGGAANCLWLAKEKAKNTASRFEAIDLLRRSFLEQLPIAATLLFFGGNLITRASSKIAGLGTEKFLPTASVLFFALLATMILNNLLQYILNNANKAFSSESDQMRHRLGRRSLKRWYSQKRYGAFINIDIRGATKATQFLGGRMHKLISVIGEALRRRAFALGFSWIHDTTKGDEWIIAHSSKGPEQDDLEDIVAMVREIEPTLQTFTKNFAERYNADLDIHCTVFYVRDYSLGPPAELDQASLELEKQLQDLVPEPGGYVKADRKPDFLGDEINHILKFCGKPTSNFIRVVGPIESVTQLSKLYESVEAKPFARLLDTHSGKYDEKHVAKLKLGFCDIPKKRASNRKGRVSPKGISA